MAPFAYFRLEHSSFNRKDWGYGRVAAHARYGANQNKVGAVATVGIPIGRTSYDTERKVMKLEKLTTRKNGRTGDTMIVSLPNEVKPEHRVLMMERFLSKVTFDGRTYAQAWEHIDKPDNPHFHVVVVDKDRVTGESVGKFGHSRSWRAKNGLEPNVTEWMRKQWEDTGNEMFSELGYGLQFDRRNFLERGTDPPGIHRGPHHQNDNGDSENKSLMEQVLKVQTPQVASIEEPIRPNTPVDYDEPGADEKVIHAVVEDAMERDLKARIADYYEGLNPGDDFEPTEEQRAEYSRELQQAEDAVLSAVEETNDIPVAEPMADPDTGRPEDADISTAAHAVRKVYADSLELNHLTHMRSHMADSQRRVDFLRMQRDKLMNEKYRHFEEMVLDKGKALAAREHLSKFQKSDGGFKGIRLKLLGKEFATDKRLQAEAAAREERERAFAAMQGEDIQNEYEAELEKLAAKLKAANEEVVMVQNEMLGPDGKLADLDDRETELKKVLHEQIREQDIDPKEAWQAWEAGDINEDELRAFCLHSGNKVMLDQLEETVRQERGQRL